MWSKTKHTIINGGCARGGVSVITSGVLFVGRGTERFMPRPLHINQDICRCSLYKRDVIEVHPSTLNQPTTIKNKNNTKSTHQHADANVVLLERLSTSLEPDAPTGKYTTVTTAAASAGTSNQQHATDATTDPTNQHDKFRASKFNATGHIFHQHSVLVCHTYPLHCGCRLCVHTTREITLKGQQQEEWHCIGNTHTLFFCFLQP